VGGWERGRDIKNKAGESVGQDRSSEQAETGRQVDTNMQPTET
jgi:hypothetical protein